MLITIDMLKEQAPSCTPQLDLFRSIFPEGAQWPEDMEKASRAGLNIVWAINNFKLTGLCRRWYSDGTIREETNWKAGEFDGVCRLWDKDEPLVV